MRTAPAGNRKVVVKIKLLCIGDIVGRAGRVMLAEHLPPLVRDHAIDCVIANAENVAGGSGLTRAAYEKLCHYGVNLITLGDHCYRKREIIDTLQNAENIVRPANLSPQAAGKEIAYYKTSAGADVAVVSILGRLFMNSLPGDNPFQAVQRVLGKIPPDIKIIVIDMHAEATSEKVAMGRLLDGRVSLVFGTHTHVPTADACILPGGTGYVTDLGMTGPHDSVLGRNTDAVLKSLLTQMPFPYGVATGDPRINGILVTVNSHTGHTEHIERITITGTSDNQDAYDETDGRPDLS